MSVKAILVLCAQALVVKSALGQCTSRVTVAATPGIGLAAPALAASRSLTAPTALPYDGLGWTGRGLPYDRLYIPVTNGGALPVSSASTIAPVDISVASENAYEGILDVVGELPFVSTLAMEGVLASAGVAINHACGNGRNAMLSENTAYGPAAAIAPAAVIAPAAFAPAALAAPAHGNSAGLAARGCGCAL